MRSERTPLGMALLLGATLGLVASTAATQQDDRVKTILETKQAIDRLYRQQFEGLSSLRSRGKSAIDSEARSYYAKASVEWTTLWARVEKGVAPPDTDIEALVFAAMVNAGALDEAVIGIRYLYLRHGIRGFGDLASRIAGYRANQAGREMAQLQQQLARGTIARLPRFTTTVELSDERKGFGDWARRLGDQQKEYIGCIATEKQQTHLLQGKSGFLNRVEDRFVPFLRELAAAGGTFADGSGNQRAECVRQVLHELLHDRVVLGRSLPKAGTGLLHCHLVNADLTIAIGSSLYGGLMSHDPESLRTSADLMSDLVSALRGIVTLDQSDLQAP